MRRIFNAAILLVLVLVMAGLGGCLEDRETEIVLNDENCEPFDEVRTNENYSTPYTLVIYEEIDELLADNDLSREQIIDAFLVSGAYTITAFEHDHPWDVGGVITVQRVGGINPPVVLLDYNDYITVNDAAVGVKTYVTLETEGVAVIDQALDDFINGQDPELIFTITSGDIDPDPSVADAMEFSWEFCLYIQVITALDTEIFQLF